MAEGARYRIRRQAAEATERAILHNFEQILQELEVPDRVQAGDDFVDDLDATSGADAAGRALAAALDGAELHRETRLAGHIDGVIEDDDAAVPDDAFARGEGFVIDWRIEQLFGEI